MGRRRCRHRPAYRGQPYAQGRGASSGRMLSRAGSGSGAITRASASGTGREMRRSPDGCRVPAASVVPRQRRKSTVRRAASAAAMTSLDDTRTCLDVGGAILWPWDVQAGPEGPSGLHRKRCLVSIGIARCGPLHALGLPLTGGERVWRLPRPLAGGGRAARRPAKLALADAWRHRSATGCKPPERARPGRRRSGWCRAAPVRCWGRARRSSPAAPPCARR